MNRMPPWSSLAVVTLMTGSAMGVSDTRYRIHATHARLNRIVIGDVIRSVGGLPAEPVDSACWDSEGSVRLQRARIRIDVDPIRNTGSIHASWIDENGAWTFDNLAFLAPHHASGLRIAETAAETRLVVGDPIATNVYLHGDTNAGPPMVPTVFAYLAAWGPARVTLDGEPFENPLDGPLPDWGGHVMVTAGVRNLDGEITTKDGDIYDMSKKSVGFTDPADLEVHLTFHDELIPPTSNIPPDFEFFYHLVFENVMIGITHREADWNAGPSTR
ncbi:MAG: hypothetical protein CME06_03925 [Gemmatimonadetes bacterium]|nr:hypothetical protein [Gemmatimonadota bacterium]